MPEVVPIWAVVCGDGGIHYACYIRGIPVEYVIGQMNTIDSTSNCEHGKHRIVKYVPEEVESVGRGREH